jgi:hypothetical protein
LHEAVVKQRIERNEILLKRAIYDLNELNASEKINEAGNIAF